MVLTIYLKELIHKHQFLTKSICLHLGFVSVIVASQVGSHEVQVYDPPPKVLNVSLINLPPIKKQPEIKQVNKSFENKPVEKEVFNSAKESVTRAHPGGESIHKGLRDYSKEPLLPPTPELDVNVANIPSARDKFDEMFDKITKKIDESNETNSRKELTFSDSDFIKKELEFLKRERELSSDIVSNVVNVENDEELDALNEEIQNKKKQLASMKEEEQKDFIDPVFLYQNKISKQIKKYLRIPPSLNESTCVLRLNLARDGMVVNMEFVSGSRDLCAQGERAAIRVGRMPVPIDNEVYEELKHIEITIGD